MVKFILGVRRPGSVELDYSLEFEAPEIPAIGSYISINRPDEREVGEDMIVRHVWWRLHHPTAQSYSEESRAGTVTEIFVECDPAIGPYSSRNWLRSMKRHRDAGIDIEEFQVSRRPFFDPDDDD